MKNIILIFLFVLFLFGTFLKAQNKVAIYV